jgi:hypothetical protein
VAENKKRWWRGREEFEEGERGKKIAIKQIYFFGRLYQESQPKRTWCGPEQK